ncbi:hypothetical protein H4582DRAFT_1918285 [Lactarius indigo]|nr:hypothetical protein H4582DRAFT_1918285 [Lactarius indigo]
MEQGLSRLPPQSSHRIKMPARLHERTNGEHGWSTLHLAGSVLFSTPMGVAALQNRGLSNLFATLSSLVLRLVLVTSLFGWDHHFSCYSVDHTHGVPIAPFTGGTITTARPRASAARYASFSLFLGQISTVLPSMLRGCCLWLHLVYRRCDLTLSTS